MPRVLTHEQKQLAFRLRARGWRLDDIAREIGCSAQMVSVMVNEGRCLSGVPDDWEPRPGCLTITDREEILVGIRAGLSEARYLPPRVRGDAPTGPQSIPAGSTIGSPTLPTRRLRPC